MELLMLSVNKHFNPLLEKVSNVPPKFTMIFEMVSDGDSGKVLMTVIKRASSPGCREVIAWQILTVHPSRKSTARYSPRLLSTSPRPARFWTLTTPPTGWNPIRNTIVIARTFHTNQNASCVCRLLTAIRGLLGFWFTSTPTALNSPTAKYQFSKRSPFSAGWEYTIRRCMRGE